MKLIVGLGNIGKKYKHTRQNMGFDALDAFAEMAGVDFDRENFKGTYGILKKEPFPEPVMLLKPSTLMNLSGESVRAAVDYFKIDIADILVIYDDMDIPEGKIRLRPDGSAGSHNGMKNIILHLGTDAFKRLRIGIGEPAFSGIDYVLGKPTKEGQEKIDEAIKEATHAIKDYLLNGWDYAMNHHNKK